jgi:hypothetical protein
MKNNFEIGHANETTAFVENGNGFDVVKIQRVFASEVSATEHKKNVLTDDQWQKFVNYINSFLSENKSI